MFISVVLPTAANTLLKTGVSRIGEQGNGIIGIVLSYLKSPMVVAGFLLYSVSALLWTYSLSKFDFSFANFMTSLSYVLVILVSLLIFKETISPMRWAGFVLILAGIFLIIKGS